MGNVVNIGRRRVEAIIHDLPGGHQSILVPHADGTVSVIPVVGHFLLSDYPSDELLEVAYEASIRQILRDVGDRFLRDNKAGCEV